jgi:hypothetical protein
MTKTYLSAEELASAFPTTLRQDVLTACGTFPAIRELGGKFRVRVNNELVTIPYRLHLDPTLIHVESLNPLQRELVDCLLTRHTNGYLRQRHLACIIGLSRSWIPPYVVQLAGEYVVEILNVICQSFPRMDRSLYRDFLISNPALLDLTGQRIASYWDCYYRNERQEEYVGFKILEFFRSLQRSA